MTTLHFGRGREYARGAAPSVATDGDLAIVVHTTTETTVRWSAGTIHPADVVWNGGDGGLGRGFVPAVAVADGVALACYQDADDGTIHYHVGSVTENGVEWSDRRTYGDGVSPDVALGREGTVVLVHGSTTDALYCCVGRLDGGTVRWATREKYDEGTAPTVSLAADGTVVEAHETEPGDFGGFGLQYRLGGIDGDGVVWREGDRVDAGFFPSITLGDDGELVLVHEMAEGTDGRMELGSWHGRVTEEDVEWVASERYGAGVAPTVDRSGPRVLELHQSEALDRGGRILATPGGLRPYATWMGANPDLQDRRLGEVTLPGTHDCGSYELGSRTHLDSWLTDWIPRSFARNWARTQRDDVAAQLAAGIRWFDLRIAEREGRFHFHHEFLGPEIGTMLRDLREFLERPAVTSELVVLKMSHFRPEDGFDHDRFASLIEEELDGFLYERQRQERLPTVRIGDVVVGGPSVIVVYDDESVAADYDVLWPFQNIYTEYSNTTDFETMRADQATKLQRYGDSALRLFELQWVLTANTGFIVSHPRSDLEFLSWGANRNLGAFFRDNTDRTINLVRVDFYRDSGVVDLAIERNGG